MPGDRKCLPKCLLPGRGACSTGDVVDKCHCRSQPKILSHRLEQVGDQPGICPGTGVFGHRVTGQASTSFNKHFSTRHLWQLDTQSLQQTAFTAGTFYARHLSHNICWSCDSLHTIWSCDSLHVRCVFFHVWLGSSLVQTGRHRSLRGPKRVCCPWFSLWCHIVWLFAFSDLSVISFVPLLSCLKGAPPGINPSSRQQKKWVWFHVWCLSQCFALLLPSQTTQRRLSWYKRVPFLIHCNFRHN